MRDLYTSMDSARLGFYRSVLEEAGIAAFIRNENLAQVTNMLAMVLQPTLCVVNDNDYEEALALLKPYHFQAATNNTEDWLCACNESNPATFDLCWNCGAARS
jgi:hypothetical protein